MYVYTNKIIWTKSIYYGELATVMDYGNLLS